VQYVVHIFNDEEQALTVNQVDAIRKLIPGTEVITWPKSPGWGIKQIDSIWRAYAYVADLASDGDYIARVDSDVFFFNDDIFRAVRNSAADLIGDGHFDDFEYCQGGCYFFKASAVKTIAKEIVSVGMPVILANLKVLADDRATRVLTERLGLKTWMTWFIMFPQELRNAGNLNRWARWKFSCFHSINKDKSMMLTAYEKELFNGVAPARYKADLLIN